MGKLIDAIVKEIEATTSSQPDSEGATDTDVLAKVGQAKERTGELFAGYGCLRRKHKFIEPKGKDNSDHCGDGIAPTAGATFRALRLLGLW